MGEDSESSVEGETNPLHDAAEDGDVDEVVRLLTAEPLLLELRDDLGDTALVLASKHGRADVVTALLERGAQIDRTGGYGETPLMAAAYHGHRAIVDLLIEKGADLAAVDAQGATVLMWAASGGSVEVVSALIRRGVIDVNTRGRRGMTALHLACYEGKVEAARVLIEKGQADTRVRDEDGKTPLEMARERGIEEVVAVLESFEASMASEKPGGPTDNNAGARFETAVGSIGDGDMATPVGRREKRCV